MENNVRFLASATPMRDVIEHLCRRRFQDVQRIEWSEPQLQMLVQEYREAHDLPVEPEKMKFCTWYGIVKHINGFSLLTCAIGFSENYSQGEGLWLWVMDLVCRPEVECQKWFTRLLRFTDAVPFMMRGIIHVGSEGMLHQVIYRHNWKLTAWCVERPAKEIK